MDNLDLAQFYKLLDDLVRFFDDLLALENKKLEAITANDMELLEQCMKDEQALIMKLKGMELKRERIQERCGFEGLSLKAVAERVMGKDKKFFLETHQTLEKKVQETKNTISLANKCANLQLYGIERLLINSEVKTKGVSI